MYKTRQRTMLLEYLMEHEDEIFTISQLIEHFKDDKISTSSLYRNLSDLEIEGQVRKFVKTGMREACYQYIHDDKCKGKIHLSCIKCDKSIHMDTASAEILSSQLMHDENFDVDKGNTVIYGVCKNCKNCKNKN